MESHGRLEAERWIIEELKYLLTTAVENLGEQKLMCFIDALDECEENQVREMVEFLEQLGHSAVTNGINFHVCLSSRHYPHISIEEESTSSSKLRKAMGKILQNTSTAS